MKPAVLDRDLTLIEAADALHVSTKTALKLIRAGVLPAHRVGRLWRFRPSAIDTCRARLQHTPSVMTTSGHAPRVVCAIDEVRAEKLRRAGGDYFLRKGLSR